VLALAEKMTLSKKSKDIFEPKDTESYPLTFHNLLAYFFPKKWEFRD